MRLNEQGVADIESIISNPFHHIYHALLRVGFAV